MKIKAKQFSLDSSVLPTHNAVDLGHEVNPMQVVYSNEFVGELTGAVRFKAKNETGTTLQKGKAVYITGVSGDVPTVALADANDSAKMPAVGLTENSASNNAEVYIVSFGNLVDINTSSLGSVGQTVFVSTTPGELTVTPPTGTSSKLQNIGQIIRSHSSAGVIKVGGAGRTAATPNLDQGHFFLGNSSNQSVESSYQLPTSIGTSGHVLTSNGTDVTFQAISGGGSVSASDITQGSSAVTIATSSGTISIDSPSELHLNSNTGDIRFQDGGTSQLSLDLDSVAGQVSMRLDTNGDDFLFKQYDGTEVFRAKDSGDFTVGANLEVRTQLKLLEDMGSSYIGLQAPSSLTSNYTFTLPASYGTSGQVLSTNGSGTLSWTTASGGGSSFSASDITGQTEHSHSLHNNDDYLVVYDGSANALKKISKGNFFKGYYTDTIPEFASLQVGDFTFDTSGGSTSQYLRLKMNSGENANEPIFLIENQSSSTYGPILAIGIREDSGNAVGNYDTLGQVRFQETQSNGSLTRWGSIACIAEDHANGYGQLQLKVKSGSNEDIALLLGTSSGGTTVDIRNHDGTDSGLKLGGQLVTASAYELNRLDGATVNATELNLLDGHTSVGSSITIADTDGFIVNDNGTTKLIPASDLKSYAGGGGGGGANVSTSSPSASTTLNYNSSNSEEFFIVTPSADVTLTLPTIGNNSIPNGYKLNIKNMSSTNTITVSPNSTGSNRIDGSSSISHSLSTQYESITFVCDGNVTWYRV